MVPEDKVGIMPNLIRAGSIIHVIRDDLKLVGEQSRFDAFRDCR